MASVLVSGWTRLSILMHLCLILLNLLCLVLLYFAGILVLLYTCAFHCYHFFSVQDGFICIGSCFLIDVCEQFHGDIWRHFIEVVVCFCKAVWLVGSSFVLLVKTRSVLSFYKHMSLLLH